MKKLKYFADGLCEYFIRTVIRTLRKLIFGANSIFIILSARNTLLGERTY